MHVLPIIINRWDNAQMFFVEPKLFSWRLFARQRIYLTHFLHVSECSIQGLDFAKLFTTGYRHVDIFCVIHLNMASYLHTFWHWGVLLSFLCPDVISICFTTKYSKYSTVTYQIFLDTWRREDLWCFFVLQASVSMTMYSPECCVLLYSQGAVTSDSGG